MVYIHVGLDKIILIFLRNHILLPLLMSTTTYDVYGEMVKY